MGTRSVIARQTKDGFTGRYHHWDGYPSGVGRTLHDLYNGHFGRDLTRMLTTLLDEHPAGWSTICGKDWSLAPGWGDGRKRPQCHCHGGRSEEEQVVTQEDAADCGCEYAYVFPPGEPRFHVLTSVSEGDVKMIGMFGFGDPSASWRYVATVELDEAAPDWELLDAKARHPEED